MWNYLLLVKIHLTRVNDHDTIMQEKALSTLLLCRLQRYVFRIVVDVARLEPWCPMSIQLTAECEVVGMRTSTKAMGLSARKGWNAHSGLIKVAPPSGWFKYLRVCPQVERKINNHSNFVHVAQLQSTS